MDQALTCGEQAVTASLRTSDKRWKLNSKVLVAECQCESNIMYCNVGLLLGDR